MGEKTDIESILFAIRGASVAYGLLGLACTAAGIFTLIYAAPDIQFPYETASGIWTGVLALITFVLGIRLIRGYSITSVTSPKGTVIAFYTFVIMDITCAILHLSYSAVGLSTCYSYTRTARMQCNTDDRPRLLLMEGFNISFAIVLTVLSLVSTIYLSVRKRLNILTGLSPDSVQQPDYTCCNGFCTCYTGCYYS